MRYGTLYLLPVSGARHIWSCDNVFCTLEIRELNNNTVVKFCHQSGVLCDAAVCHHQCMSEVTTSCTVC